MHGLIGRENNGTGNTNLSNLSNLNKRANTQYPWMLALFFILYFINIAFATVQAETSPTIRDATNAIARAQFTTAMQQKEPTDNVVLLNNNNPQVYFFTEIKNYTGGMITHRWEYQGTVMAEVSFNVGGPRWRVHSSKKLKPHWTGIWSVVVLDEHGSPLKISSFEVIEP